MANHVPPAPSKQFKSAFVVKMKRVSLVDQKEGILANSNVHLLLIAVISAWKTVMSISTIANVLWILQMRVLVLVEKWL
jgi:hypothetical protein